MAFAPAGGWAHGDKSVAQTLDQQQRIREESLTAVSGLDAIVATATGRRRATGLVVERFEHIPPKLIAHLVGGVANCNGAAEMVEYAQRADWSLAADRITVLVRIVWGTEHKLLPWPSAAARFQHDWLPHADWGYWRTLATAPNSTSRSRRRT